VKPDLSRAQWRRSSYSGNSGNCIEAADLKTTVAIRDSKNPDSSVLIVKPVEWLNFIHMVKSTNA
jgi:hypothetical protein